jgi:hypothetical protein
MTRSKLSTEAVLFANAIGCPWVRSPDHNRLLPSYTCPDGLAYEAAVGCTTPGWNDYWVLLRGSFGGQRQRSLIAVWSPKRFTNALAYASTEKFTESTTVSSS